VRESAEEESLFEREIVAAAEAKSRLHSEGEKAESVAESSFRDWMRGVRLVVGPSDVKFGIEGGVAVIAESMAESDAAAIESEVGGEGFERAEVRCGAELGTEGKKIALSGGELEGAEIVESLVGDSCL
jgi:hypothetical protein